MLKNTVAIVIAGLIIIVTLNLSGSGNKDGYTPTDKNVSVENSKQIVEIKVKGGYSPYISLAKADMPTILRMKTSGSFDCSSAVAIPSIGYRSNLPLSGITDIEIPSQKSGTVLQGRCAMGMYNFQVKFN